MPGRFSEKASIGMIESGGGFLFGDPMNPGDFSFPIEISGPVSAPPSSHLRDGNFFEGLPHLKQAGWIRK
jgi:hypothetical protein